jgi:hypothetical protein
MGSWSVYCGISQIAITASDECVLLPLKENKRGDSYSPYLPATLPIFGKYDDYGGIENIEEDDNTKLIEKYFGISILDFTKLFTDWKAYERSECLEIIDRCKNFDEIKNWNFMFINRNVYYFMSTHLDGDVKGHLDFGNKELLELIGFKYIGENTNNPVYHSKRYNQEWEFDGKKFYSDGTWIHQYNADSKRENAIFYFNNNCNDENALTKQINVPEDKMWIGEKAMWQLWKFVNKSKQKELLGWIINERSSMYDDIDFDKYFEKDSRLKAKLLNEENSKLSSLYFKNISSFGDGLADLVTIRHNLHCMSGYFTPFIKYLTPQCGEHRNHQVLLQKFAEINNQLLIERGGDE